MTFKTEQEAFWAGEFGTEYIQRNQGDALLAANLDFFAKALRAARGVKACIEFGANICMNLKALKLLHPTQEQHGIEINVSIRPAPYCKPASFMQFQFQFHFPLERVSQA